MLRWDRSPASCVYPHVSCLLASSLCSASLIPAIQTAHAGAQISATSGYEKQDPERGNHLNLVLELLCVPGFGEFLGTQEKESHLHSWLPHPLQSERTCECHQDLNPRSPASVTILTLRMPLGWGELASLHPYPQVY
ncbi:uncharacterized protein LOC144335651 isoform X1 [Macaca mulatta]